MKLAFGAAEGDANITIIIYRQAAKARWHEPASRRPFWYNMVRCVDMMGRGARERALLYLLRHVLGITRLDIYIDVISRQSRAWYAYSLVELIYEITSSIWRHFDEIPTLQQSEVSADIKIWHYYWHTIERQILIKYIRACLFSHLCGNVRLLAIAALTKIHLWPMIN